MEIKKINKETIECLINQTFIAEQGELRTVGNGVYLAFIGNQIMDVTIRDANNYEVHRSITYNIPLRYLID